MRTLLSLTRANDGTMSLLGLPVPAERNRALAKVDAIVDEPGSTVIPGWIVGWSGVGAWRMMTRDA